VRIARSAGSELICSDVAVSSILHQKGFGSGVSAEERVL